MQRVASLCKVSARPARWPRLRGMKPAERARRVYDAIHEHINAFSQGVPTGMAFDLYAERLEDSLEQGIPELGAAARLFKWHSPEHVRVPALHLSYSTEFSDTIVVGLLAVPRGREHVVQDFHTLSTGGALPHHYTGVPNWMRPEIGTVRPINEFARFARGGGYGGLQNGKIGDHHKRPTADDFPDPDVLDRVLDALERARRR
jgi:hypothetical protein